MRLHLKNISMLHDAEIDIPDITVIAGKNDSVKSIFGKALYAVFHALHRFDVRVALARRERMERLLKATTSRQSQTATPWPKTSTKSTTLSTIHSRRPTRPLKSRWDLDHKQCPNCLSAFRSTVVACSRPKDGAPLVDSTETVSVFATVKDHYAQRLRASHLPSSADSLFLSNAGDPVLAEFKSNSCQVKEIAQKIYDSVLIASELLDVSDGWLREPAAFVLMHPSAGTLSVAGLKHTSLAPRYCIPLHVEGFFLTSAEEITPTKFIERFL